LRLTFGRGFGSERSEGRLNGYARRNSSNSITSSIE
jgi:hypothetical protein